jgi:hypothetical protein
MAKMYLKGSSVESNSARRKARLLGIAHEIYEHYCHATLNNPNFEDRTTKYCFSVKEKDGEFCLEVDTEQAEYNSLPNIHVNRLVDKATMEADGWTFE